MRRQGPVRKTRRTATRRTSVSLPRGLHRELAQIAEHQRVSLAWVLRDAAQQYVEAKWPLLAQRP